MRNALNPGVLLLGSVLLSMVVLVRHSWEMNVAFAAFSFVLIACCRRRTWRRIGALLAGLSGLSVVYFLTAYFHPKQSLVTGLAENTAFFIALELDSRVFALGAIGISLCTSIEKNAFIASLIQQFRIPVPIAYSILVAINFLGLIRSEYQQAELALRMRGVSGLSVHSKALLTMIIRLIRQSEYTAIAMEAKGFSARRVQRIVPRITRLDAAYIGFVCCCVLAALVVGQRGG